jgi:hypothetical protein
MFRDINWWQYEPLGVKVPELVETNLVGFCSYRLKGNFAEVKIQ